MISMSMENSIFDFHATQKYVGCSSLEMGEMISDSDSWDDGLKYKNQIFFNPCSFAWILEQV